MVWVGKSVYNVGDVDGEQPRNQWEAATSGEHEKRRRRPQLKITVVGLGHLGTVAAGGLAMAGHQVTGVDINHRHIALLESGKTPFHEPGLETWIRKGTEKGRLRFFHRDEIAGPLGDVALIATGTPPNGNGSPDLRQVQAALRWVKSRRPGNLAVVMKSTVPPGTGQAILREELKGTDIRYVANPEFLREGRALEDWEFPCRIVVGIESGDEQSLDLVAEMYSGTEAPYLVTDITSAEMVKYASNAFLATRISFINEIASLCDQVGASVGSVSTGLAMDARMGSRIHAGIGYGGSCLPKDVNALSHLASAKGVDADLLTAVTAVNQRQRLLPLLTLRGRFPKGLAGLQVGVLGLAYKPGTDDVREAASLDLIRALVEEGVQVRAFDPRANRTARGLLPATVDFVDRPEEAARGSQALALLTEWPEIVDADWGTMARDMEPPRFLFDGRNALDAGLMARLGFDYKGVGRSVIGG